MTELCQGPDPELRQPRLAVPKGATYTTLPVPESEASLLATRTVWPTRTRVRSRGNSDSSTQTVSRLATVNSGLSPVCSPGLALRSVTTPVSGATTA